MSREHPGPEAVSLQGEDRLEQLGHALRGRGFLATVHRSPLARGAFLRVINPRVTTLTEQIYVSSVEEGRHFWWSWAERITPVEEVEAAAERVAYVLTPSRASGPG